MNSDNQISIHDNRLVSYEVFCERREIRLHTEFRDRGEPFEFTDVLFLGVLAYDFWHDSDMGTILLDISEVPPIEIYDSNRDQFADGVRYGWPGDWADTAEHAALFFQEHGIRGFEISSSCGMSGWVLAHEMKKELRSPNQSAQPGAAGNSRPGVPLTDL